MSIQKILENIFKNTAEIPDGKPYFGDKRYTPYELSEKNFHLIEDSDINPIYAIDGGNQEIFNNTDLSIHFVRIYFNKFFPHRTALKNNHLEYYVIVNSEVKQENLLYQARIVPLNHKQEFSPLVFNPFDQTMTHGKFSSKISEIGGIIRRFLEWNVVKQITEQAEPKSIILRDGSLQTGYMNENEFSEKAYSSIKERNISFMAVVKSPNVYTSTGKNLQKVLFNKGSKIIGSNKYYYYPVFDIQHPDHKAKMFFAKFHPNADRLFRTEIFQEQEITPEVLFSLAKNSTDPRFLGYPYALIDADHMARVTEQEKNFHKTKLSKAIKTTRDAHEILDNLFK